MLLIRNELGAIPVVKHGKRIVLLGAVNCGQEKVKLCKDIGLCISLAIAFGYHAFVYK